MRSLPAGAATVAIAASLLSLNRFGALAGQEPRAFLRLALVGIWGWPLLAATSWLIATTITRRHDGLPGLQRVLAVHGRAHLSLAALAGVLFVAAGALQLRWPGLIAAYVVFAWWFPATLIVGLRSTTQISMRTAGTSALAAYALWLATVGRHLDQQLGHLV